MSIWTINIKDQILYFKSLKYFGLGRGYYPKPFKILLIMHPDNPKTGKQFGLYCTFKVCTGAHYLGSFIDDNSFKRCWMQDCTVMWKRKIFTTAVKYPYESHSALDLAFQLEWIFLQQVTQDTHLRECKRFPWGKKIIPSSLGKLNISHPL